MAQIHKHEAEFEVKLSADKYFDAFKNRKTQYIKCLPEVFKSVQVLEGDGVNVGNVKLWNCVLDGKSFTVKERTTLLDNKNRSISWSFFEGEVMNHFNRFDIKLVSVTPKGEGSCLAKWEFEFQKKDENAPYPTSILEVPRRISQVLSSN